MKIKKAWKITAIVLILILVILASAFGYAYYADITAIEKLEFKVDYVTIPEISLTYCKLKLMLNISNPTNYRVSSLSTSFTIYLANNSIGNGSMNDISLPAHSSVQEDMVVTIHYAGVVGGVIDAIKNGRFVLTVKGKGTADAMWGLTKGSKSFEVSYVYPPED